MKHDVHQADALSKEYTFSSNQLQYITQLSTIFNQIDISEAKLLRVEVRIVAGESYSEPVSNDISLVPVQFAVSTEIIVGSIAGFGIIIAIRK